MINSKKRIFIHLLILIKPVLPLLGLDLLRLTTKQKFTSYKSPWVFRDTLK